jgi:hypothetical protein
VDLNVPVFVTKTVLCEILKNIQTCKVLLCINFFKFMYTHVALNLYTGGRRFSEGTSADREIQRTLMELLNQMDGFDSLGQVKCSNQGQWQCSV